MTQLQEQIRRLKQELDAAREQVRELEKNCPSQGALRESEERLRFVTEQSPDNIFIQDRELRYLWVSKPAHPLTLEEYLGRIDYDLVPPEDAQRLTELKMRVLAEGQPVSAEIPLQLKGERRIFDAVYKPWRDVEGFVVGLIGYVRDITERKRAEEALQRTAERYEQQVRLFDGVASTTPDFVYIFDLQGRFLYANKRLLEVWGMELPDIIGKTCRELGYEPWHHEMHMGEIAQVIETKRPIKGEVPFTAPVTGISGVYEYIFTPVFGQDGEVEFVAGTTRDITERKQAENGFKEAKAAAENTTRAKSEFLAKMSHEIRTPMTVFMAAIEHLLQIDRDPERRHLLGMADQAAQRLRSLIDDILDLSRIEARKVEIEERPFDLRACVRAAVDLFTLPAQEKNLRLETEVAPEIPEVVCSDPDKIGQVLLNLIGNAVKFTHQGEVRVCVQPRGGSLEFTVADTGIGIPEDKHPLLFQSFSQLDNTFSSKFGGSGLGLAISKGLVELMGGEISVRSRTGQGSAFTFTVPLRVVANPDAATETPSEESERPRPPARILLAEDDPMIREMITMMLGQRGFHPETAGSGRQAVEKWREGDFDLIFMDLQMPEMDGFEATQAIRQQEMQGRKRPCIIGLTGHASLEIKEQCLGAGMDQVLTKPVKIKDLLSALDTCL